MNLFARLSELLDLDGSLGQDEDLEAALNQILLEMEQIITAAKRYAAAVIASEGLLARELEQANSAVDAWRSKARQALSSGDEASARRAVRRQREWEASANRLGGHHAAVRQTSEELKTWVCDLEMRLTEARRKRRVMLAWETIALCRINLRRRLGSAMNGSQAVAERMEQLEAALDGIQEELWAHAGGNGSERGSLHPRSDPTENWIDQNYGAIPKSEG